MNILYSDAVRKFLDGDYSEEDFFRENNYRLEYAYCRLFAGDVKTAQFEFRKLEHLDFRADWGNKLTGFINCNVVNLPSYFQVRNFLEIDLNLLINARQPEYVENIINGADLFYSVNPESYKFISRVMLFNDYVDIALFYLLKAKEKFYYDPEMHFMLANCYIKNNDILLAKKSLINCLTILPEYYPARKLLDNLKG
jgi:hypothetical protein